MSTASANGDDLELKRTTVLNRKRIGISQIIGGTLFALMEFIHLALRASSGTKMSGVLFDHDYIAPGIWMGFILIGIGIWSLLTSKKFQTYTVVLGIIFSLIAMTLSGFLLSGGLYSYFYLEHGSILSLSMGIFGIFQFIVAFGYICLVTCFAKRVPRTRTCASEHHLRQTMRSTYPSVAGTARAGRRH